MSFASPVWLLALLLIPLAVVAQRAGEHRARRYAIRFPAAASLQEAVGVVADRSRFVPLAALLAAVAAIVLALAKPQHTVHVPIGSASIVLVTDHSGSMAANDVSPNRLAAAVRAADAFISELPSTVRLGAVTFSTTPDTVQAPEANHAVARGVIQAQTANGGTDTGDALQDALNVLQGSNPHHVPSAIVLLSDGDANLGPSPLYVAQTAKTDKIPIYTVALGTPDGVLNTGPFSAPVPVPPDPQLMSEIASSSGGRTFTARSADQLSSIYQNLGNRLSTVSRQRDITGGFVFAAAVLLLLAGVATQRRTRVFA